MYNRALGDLLQDEPSFFVMHDWWLALTASAFGLIVPLDEATILYRQHGDNAVGAKFVRSPRYLLRRLFDVKGYRKELAETFLQSESFYDAFRDRLSPEQRALTAGYGSLSQAGVVAPQVVSVEKPHCEVWRCQKSRWIFIWIKEKTIMKGIILAGRFRHQTLPFDAGHL